MPKTIPKNKKEEESLGYNRDFVLLTTFYQSFLSLRELTKSVEVNKSALPSEIEARSIMAVDEGENMIYLLNQKEVVDSLVRNGMSEFTIYSFRRALENFVEDVINNAKEPKGFFQNIEKLIGDYKLSKIGATKSLMFSSLDEKGWLSSFLNLDDWLRQKLGSDAEKHIGEYNKFVFEEQATFKSAADNLNKYINSNLEQIIVPLFNFAKEYQPNISKQSLYGDLTEYELEARGITYQPNISKQSLYGIYKTPSFITYQTYRDLGGKKINPNYLGIKTAEVTQGFITPMVVDYVVSKYLSGENISVKGVCGWLAADLIATFSPVIIVRLIGGKLAKKSIIETVKTLKKTANSAEDLFKGNLLDDVLKQIENNLAKNFPPEELKKVMSSIEKEFEKGIKELSPSTKILARGALDLVERNISGSALAYLTFKRTSETLNKLGFSESASNMMAFFVASSEAKMYTLPGHATRTSDLVDFIKNSLKIESKGLFVLHDLGKVVYSTRALRGETGWLGIGGSEIHKIANKMGNNSIIKEGMQKGHTYWEDKLIESLEKSGIMNANDKKLYEELKPYFFRVFDHHEYGSFLGKAPLKEKATNMFVDSLDAAFSLRRYKGAGVPTETKLLEDAQNFIKPRSEVAINAHMDALDAAELKIDDMINILAEYNKQYATKFAELFGENYRVAPKLNQSALKRISEEMGRKFEAFKNANKYFNNLVAAYLKAEGKERIILEYAIVAMLK